MSNFLKLLCMVHDSNSRPFPVEVKKQDLIGELKKTIKQEGPSLLKDINAADLQLWSCHKPTKEARGSKLNDEDILDETQEIGYYFKDTPEKGVVHILVIVPEPCK
ncbi:hypothetical protein BGX38DRAFT_1146643 [Terfezia claveryi]|nr:hypothetical protein BGX38DRAFT_1146643 [Terfezia claveryi]